MELSVGDIVRLLPHKGDKFNEYGKINSDKSDEKGRYWVTNLNMPFMGTISDWFYPEHLEKINE